MMVRRAIRKFGLKAGLAIAVAWLAALPGCRSATSTDLIERELRNQEDQIYALQDYLNDYQQLLCEYRQENATLKKQLIDGQFRDGEPIPPPRGRAPRRPQPTLAPDDELPTSDAGPSSDIPPLDFDDSDVEDGADVPPLDMGSADGGDGVSLAAAETELEPGDESHSDTGEVATPKLLDEMPLDDPIESGVEQVLVHGEVWPGDAETGPRVLARVAVLSAAGQPVDFFGNISVMVLDMSVEEEPVSLARWDFSPDQWQEMALADEQGTVVEFPLQLPEDLAMDRPVELWVRLIPEEGDKVLNHAAIDFGAAGQFASTIVTQSAVVETEREPIIEPADARTVVQAAVEQPPVIDRATVPIEQSGWQVALPGRPAVLRTASDQNTSEWRTAAQPIPEVASMPARSTAPRRDVFDDRYADMTPKRADSPRPAVELLAPKWSPERAGRGHVESNVKSPPVGHIVPPPRPSWSPFPRR